MRRGHKSKIDKGGEDTKVRLLRGQGHINKIVKEGKDTKTRLLQGARTQKQDYYRGQELTKTILLSNIVKGGYHTKI